ncbi:hypothetical protein ACQBAU_08620 [Propionibacteriaceae bacterium Y2011]
MVTATRRVKDAVQPETRDVYTVHYNAHELAKPMKNTAVMYTAVAVLWLLLALGTTIFPLVLGISLPLYLMIIFPAIAVVWGVLTVMTWRNLRAAKNATVALELDQHGITHHSPTASTMKRIPWSESQISWGDWLGRPVFKFGKAIRGQMLATSMLQVAPVELHQVITNLRGTPPTGAPPQAAPPHGMPPHGMPPQAPPHQLPPQQAPPQQGPYQQGTYPQDPYQQQPPPPRTPGPDLR